MPHVGPIRRGGELPDVEKSGEVASENETVVPRGDHLYNEHIRRGNAMLEWVVDSSWWLLGLLGLTLVVLAYLWWANRQRGLLVAAAVVTGLMALLWLLGQVIVTDRQQIVNAVNEMAAAVSARRPDDVIKYLAEDFEYAGSGRTITKDDVRQALKRAAEHYGVHEVTVSQFQFDKVAPAEGRAAVQFQFSVFDGSGDALALMRAKADFVRVNGKWLMRTIRFYKAFTNSDQEFHVNVP